MAKFKSVKEAEEYLEKIYLNKTVKLELPSRTVYGKIDSIAIDNILHNPAIIIIKFNDGSKEEVDKNEFYNSITLLN